MDFTCFIRFASFVFDSTLSILKRGPKWLTSLKFLRNEIQNSNSTPSGSHGNISCVRVVDIVIKHECHKCRGSDSSVTFVTIRVYQVKFGIFIEIKIDGKLCDI